MLRRVFRLSAINYIAIISLQLPCFVISFLEKINTFFLNFFLYKSFVFSLSKNLFKLKKKKVFQNFFVSNFVVEKG